MTSFSFRNRDLIALLVAVLFAAVSFSLAHSHGRPFNVTPVLGILTAIASVLTNAYYNAKRLHREIRFSNNIESTPLTELRNRVIRELLEGRRELNKLRAESEEMKIANAIAQMDRTATLALLKRIARPSRKDVWADRAVGFLLGIAASLVASYVYTVLELGSNS